MKELDWKYLIKHLNMGFAEYVDSPCPICEIGLRLSNTSFMWLHCKNNCFSISTVSTTWNSVGIYGKYFNYFYDTNDMKIIEDNKQTIIDIEKEINYWKEDYRYLVEMLERM